MTEFSPSKSRRFPRAGSLENMRSGDKGRSTHNDWLFDFLIILAILTFILALMVSLLKTMSFMVPNVGWLNRAASSLDNSTIWLSFLPVKLPVGFLISVSLLVFSGMFFVFARQRILNTPTMRPEAGCPSCQKIHLVRVHRNRIDRLVSSIGIPYARYQCRDCPWNGLRINQKERLSSMVGEMVLMQTAAVAIKEPTISGHLENSPKNFEQTKAVSINKNSTGAKPMELENLFASKDMNFRSALSEIINWQRPSREDASTENQETVQGQEIVNESECAKVVSPLSLNLRQDPQLDGKVIGTLEPGTIVEMLDNIKQADGITWRQIRVNNQDGWVFHSFLGLCT